MFIPTFQQLLTMLLILDIQVSTKSGDNETCRYNSQHQDRGATYRREIGLASNQRKRLAPKKHGTEDSDIAMG